MGAMVWQLVGNDGGKTSEQLGRLSLTESQIPEFDPGNFTSPAVSFSCVRLLLPSAGLKFSSGKCL